MNIEQLSQSLEHMANQAATLIANEESITFRCLMNVYLAAVLAYLRLA